MQELLSKVLHFLKTGGVKILILILLLFVTAALLVLGSDTCKVWKISSKSYYYLSRTNSTKCTFAVSPQIAIKSTNFILFTYNEIADNLDNYPGGVIIMTKNLEQDSLVDIASFPGSKDKIGSTADTKVVAAFNSNFPRSDLFPYISSDIVAYYELTGAVKTLYVKSAKLDKDASIAALDVFLKSQNTSVAELKDTFDVTVIFVSN